VLDNILLVDDEPGVLLTLGAILAREGFWVDTAASAKEAIQKLKTGVFHLVITDMRMESMSAGYRVLEAANAQPHIPVTVILTGHAAQCADWQARGASALFEKPVNIEDLLLSIDTLLHSPQVPTPQSWGTQP